MFTDNLSINDDFPTAEFPANNNVNVQSEYYTDI